MILFICDIKYQIHPFLCPFPQGVCLLQYLIISQDENPDLFYAVPWSYGTLGFLVAAELDIIPAKKYVKLEYTPLNNRKELCSQFPAAAASIERYDFVETLMYDKERSVLMRGKLTDEAESDKV